MSKTVENDNQDDWIGRGTNLIKYVPCVKPPFAEITQDFIADRLLFIHDAALLDEKKNYTAALKAVEILAKMKGMLESKVTNINNVANATSNKTIEVTFE